MDDQPCVLAVQLSNAETKCGVFFQGALVTSWAMATHVRATSDELEHALRSFLAEKRGRSDFFADADDVDLHAKNVRDTKDAKAAKAAPPVEAGVPIIDQAILCSVVPMATDAWFDALKTVCAKRPLVVGPGLKTGLSLGYKDPAQIGADRVVCAVAARELAAREREAAGIGEQGAAGVIVVDFSHATTTFSVVNGKGAFAGGAIAPGLAASMDALGASAAQLVPLNIRMPKSVLGRSTVDAVQAGVVRGEVLRTDAFIDALWEELGETTALIATGRYASLVARSATHHFRVEPDLALKGLYHLWCLNSVEA